MKTPADILKEREEYFNKNYSGEDNPNEHHQFNRTTAIMMLNANSDVIYSKIGEIIADKENEYNKESLLSTLTSLIAENNDQITNIKNQD